MLSFIAENSFLLFVVQSNQLIEHVSIRLEGLGIFPCTKIPVYLVTFRFLRKIEITLNKISLSVWFFLENDLLNKKY